MTQEERLPLWLRPYEVLVTSARTALIEFVPNTASIHAIKAKSPQRSSLRDHYVARFGPVVSAYHSTGLAGRGPRHCVCTRTIGANKHLRFRQSSDSEPWTWPAAYLQGTPQWAAAQRAFVESMAAYSLVSHLLQVQLATD